MDGPIWRKYLASGASGIARLPFPSSTGQVAGQLFGLSFGTVDVGVYRFMADPNGLAIVSETARNLFRCPAGL